MPLSLDNDIIPYTSTFIRLSHLYQEFCVYCIVIMNDAPIIHNNNTMDTEFLADLYQGVGGGTGDEYYLIVFFICAFVFGSLMSCLTVSHSAASKSTSSLSTPTSAI